jgi:hypothetical protein
VAGIAIGEVGAQLALLVAVEADAHGTDDLAADGIKTMPDAAMTVATGDIHGLSVAQLVVGGAQPVVGKFGRQMGMAGQADLGIAHRGVDYDPLVCGFDFLRSFLSIVTGDATDAAVNLGRGLGLDGQLCYSVGVGAPGGERLGLTVAVAASFGGGCLGRNGRTVPMGLSLD